MINLVQKKSKSLSMPVFIFCKDHCRKRLSITGCIMIGMHS